MSACQEVCQQTQEAVWKENISLVIKNDLGNLNIYFFFIFQYQTDKQIVMVIPFLLCPFIPLLKCFSLFLKIHLIYQFYMIKLFVVIAKICLFSLFMHYEKLCMWCMYFPLYTLSHCWCKERHIQADAILILVLMLLWLWSKNISQHNII